MKYFFAIIVLMMASQCKFFDPKTKRVGKPIPSINVLLLDSITVLNTQKLPAAKSTVLVFFDPYCDHCSEEISGILKNLKRFGDTQFCFMSIGSLTDVKTFYGRYIEEDYPNVHIGVDTGWAYLRYFRPPGVPHTSIFSSDKTLKKELPYQVSVEQLLAELK